MDIFSLCSGVGMLDEGLRIGLAYLEIESRVVGYCERDAYAQAVLMARMEESSLEPAAICDSLEDIDERWRGCVDIITAGFPCQPWSQAGSRNGTDDQRWIWPEIARVVRDTQPAMVFLENVAGLVSGGGLHHVLDDLAEIGFDAEWCHLTASAVGANHARNRVFILGHSRSAQRTTTNRRPQHARRKFVARRGEVADTGREHIDIFERTQPIRESTGGSGEVFAPCPSDLHRWARAEEWRAPAIKPGFRVLANGDAAFVVDANRADQLRCSGNSVVALQAAAAFVHLFRRLTACPS